MASHTPATPWLLAVALGVGGEDGVVGAVPLGEDVVLGCVEDEVALCVGCFFAWSPLSLLHPLSASAHAAAIAASPAPMKVRLRQGTCTPPCRMWNQPTASYQPVSRPRPA
jgi:hypothetical protein